MPSTRSPEFSATAFLIAAGDALAASLDYAETLQQVAALAVPALGDMCIVDVVEDGELRRLAIAHASAGKVDLLRELARRYPASGGSPAPAARVLASGRAELVRHVDSATLADRTVDDAHAQLIRAIGLRSHLAVPMVARGALVGVISLGITESDATYGDADRELAEELARRAALAVDNARLYRVAKDEVARRRVAEAELRLSAQRFRAVMEQSPMSTQLLDPTGRTLAVNAAWERLFGLGLGDLDGYNVLEDPQLEALGIAPLLRRAFAGEPVSLPTVMFDPQRSVPGRGSPSPRWVSAFAYPVRDAGHAVREVVLVHRDVTEEREAQARLRESEGRLSRALEAGGMNVWDWDLVTGTVVCSDNAQAFWGRQIGSAADFVAVIHPDDQPAVQAAATAAIDRGSEYLTEYRMRGPDGRERWMQSRGEVHRDADGRAVRLLGVTLDISPRREAEQAVRVLADAGRILGTSLDVGSTLQAVADVVVPELADWYAVDLLDAEGALDRVSVAHRDAERVRIAQALHERYPSRRDVPHGAWHVIATGVPEWAPDIPDERLRLAAYDDTHLSMLRSLELRSYIIVPLIARGSTIGVLTLVQAESGRRYTQADVELAANLAGRIAAAVDNARLYGQLQLEHRRKDEFLATLAHELRNPLAPVRSGLAVLDASPVGEAAERARRIMHRQLAHMVRLIDDLLDLSRVTRDAIDLQRAPVEVAPVVQAAIEATGGSFEAAGVTLDATAPATPLAFDVDAARITQVLTNLLANAVKFTPSGGRVTVTAGADGDDVLIAVADTGIGIPAEQLEHVFDMFTRSQDPANQGGLGIGLTLARRLVLLHGGQLHAESDGPGTGSRFIVRLPRAAMPAPGAEPAAGDQAPAPPGTRPLRVLVVDDNGDAADTLAELIGLHGHTVDTAGDARSGLELAAAAPPDIAFLDIGLPDMSGYDLATRLRADPRTAAARLVALTGWGRAEDIERALAAGFDAHLTKPVAGAAVLDIVGAAAAPGGAPAAAR